MKGKKKEWVEEDWMTEHGIKQCLLNGMGGRNTKNNNRINKWYEI